jgi:nicotinate phosphoribosyltransferase
VFAARELGIKPSGTMAHSYIQVHESEEDAFSSFADIYKENAVLLVDTYNSQEGIKTAARVAARKAIEKVRIKGVRIDSGDLAVLSRIARTHFDERGVGFLKIIVSGGLDEYSIRNLVNQKAPIDGFGVGTSFATSLHAPALDIIYKLVEYNGRPAVKYSPKKETYPKRKSLRRIAIKGTYREDRVEPFGAFKDDIIKPFFHSEPLDSIKARLTGELKSLNARYKEIESPAAYPVAFSSEIAS